MTQVPTKAYLREPESLATLILRFGDVAVVVLSAWAAFALYLATEPVPVGLYPYPVLIVVLLILTLFPPFGLYRTLRGIAFFDEVRILTAAWALIFGVVAVIALFTKAGHVYSRGWIALWFLGGWLSMLVFRFVLRRVLRWMREQGFGNQDVIVVGAGDLARNIIRRLQAAPWTGLRVRGAFWVKAKPTQGEDLGVPLLGTLENLPAYEAQNAIHQIWIALPLTQGAHLQRILHALRHSTADIRYVPDLFGIRLINHSVSDVAGIPVMNVSVTPISGVNRLAKEVEDRMLAAIVLSLASPLLLLIAVGVKLSSPGPVLYRQERVGWNGDTFTMLKFRSMPVHVERDGPVWGNADKKETTRFGALLRYTGLDELPQFWNVLRGDMSIVGPRPERPMFVEQFKDEVPDYMKKHIVKAGITGWAQINGLRGDTDLAKRIEYDLFYIENWSLWLDLKIMFRTVLIGLTNGAIN